jgi:hypothetical protein
MLHEIPSEQRKLLLENMVHGPAFALFCEKWEDHVEVIQKEINDVKTSDERTRELKQVRAHLVETRHPRKVVEAMIRTL